jgi:Rrf2 family protein
MGKMFSLSEAASIGLHSMILVARSKDGLNVNNIAETTGFSRHHVAKILQRLVKGGFLKSLRGPSGGFFLNIKSTDASLLEIYECIEGKAELATCPMNNKVCPQGKCLINNITHKMSLEFIHYMESQKLSVYI